MVSSNFGNEFTWFVCYCTILCLYIAGYSWEFLFSGVVISALYELGFQFATLGLSGLTDGISIGQAFWGAWLSLVLFANLAGKFKNLRKTSVPFFHGRNVFFGILITLVDILYVGCIIGFAFASSKSTIKYRQSLMSMITLVIGLILLQIGFVLYRFCGNRRKYERVDSTFDQVDTLAFANAIEEGTVHINSDTDPEPGICHLCSPNAKFPFNVISVLIRLIILSWGMWIFILLLTVIITDRIMAPCEIPWNQS